MGTWLRVKEPADTSLSSKLEKFKPELHGGEFPASEPKNLEELANRARAAADRAMMAIDDMLTMVHASNERIADMERRASGDGTAKGAVGPHGA